MLGQTGDELQRSPGVKPWYHVKIHIFKEFYIPAEPPPSVAHPKFLLQRVVPSQNIFKSFIA